MAKDTMASDAIGRYRNALKDLIDAYNAMVQAKSEYDNTELSDFGDNDFKNSNAGITAAEFTAAASAQGEIVSYIETRLETLYKVSA